MENYRTLVGDTGLQGIWNHEHMVERIVDTLSPPHSALGVTESRVEALVSETGVVVTPGEDRALEGHLMPVRGFAEGMPEQKNGFRSPTVAGIQWARKHYGHFEPFTISGTDQGIIEIPEGVKHGLITCQHHDHGTIRLMIFDESGDATGEVPVDTVGHYVGTTIFGLYGFGTPCEIAVMAQGAWTVTVTPVHQAPMFSMIGSGDNVFIYEGDDADLDVTHSGMKTFTMTQQYENGLETEVLVQESGDCQVDVELMGGSTPSLVVITGEEWNIKKIK